MLDAVAGVVKQGLVRLGWYDERLPPSYADGAAAIGGLPPLSRPAAPPAPEPPPAPAVEPPSLVDALGARPLTIEAVEEVLDELVRPALNADGGDITLIKIEYDNVYVKLVGACSSCPSSVMTMRMGVERLLQEEFPQMNELIQVDGMFA
jgi:Fe-S cluster biogenesis protein NfuA